MLIHSPAQGWWALVRRDFPISLLKTDFSGQAGACNLILSSVHEVQPPSIVNPDTKISGRW
uniref:Uncharacterized protein n=1 Tax=Anguilla anguilla TaxID=7936 RepID=A0A0E9WAI1_ANGAN